MDVETSWLWIVIVAFIIAFVLAFGLGANDVANSFGTSVGAKVLTVRQACILGTIFEILGAVLVGAKVSNTIRKGIVDPEMFSNGTEEVFMAGNMAALTGSCIWLMAATFFSLPVSGTHSIVGATLGFSLVINGTKGISWVKLAMIVASWFLSPLISGIVSCLMFKSIDVLIIKKKNPLKSGLRLLPVFYAITMAVNLFSIFYEGSRLLHFDKIPLYGTFILTFGPAILIAFFVKVFIVPRQRKKILDKISGGPGDEEDVQLCTDDSREPPPTTINEIFEQTIVVKNGAIGFRSNGPHLNGRTSRLSDGLNTNPIKGGVPETEDDRVEEAESLDNDDLDTDGEISKLEDGLVNHAEKIEQTKQLVAMDPSTVDHEPPGKAADDRTTDRDVVKDDRTTDREKARDMVHDKPETAQLFTFLQVLTAVFGSFAHGGNDVSNAIGPIVAIWVTFSTGSTAQSAPVPIWVLIYGGLGISVGLWVWGRRVMKTMGEDLTKITPSSGFCIEVGSALTVIVASNIGIPISTTHCKVGSVVCVGRLRSKSSVDWGLFRNIVFAWCVTLPVSAGLSALAMLGYQAILNAV